MITELDRDSFKAAMNSSAPALVEFWAGWCMPCKMFAPVLEELAGEFDGRADFYKLNIDEHPELAAKFGIELIPTVILFKDGKAAKRLVGPQPKKDIAAALEKLI